MGSMSRSVPSGRSALLNEQVEVIVVDDHLMMRKGIEVLLLHDGLRIAGVAGSLGEARALLARRRYDVLLLDLHLGEEISIGLVEELVCRDANAPIVLYTGYTNDDAELQAAALAGARGFVLKASPSTRLIGALRTVAAGGTYVDSGLAPLLFKGANVSLLTLLSPRERQTLELLASGLTGQAIAERLVLSPETVRTHIRNATIKLGASTRVQAVALVVQALASR